MKNKKGISIIVLVILIIVVVILAGATIFMYNKTNEKAQLATFYNNIAIAQEVVSQKMLNNLMVYNNDNVPEEKIKDYRWIGIIEGYDVDMANSDDIIVFKPIDVLPEEKLAKVDKSIFNNTSTFNEKDKNEFYVNENGYIFNKGFEQNGKTLYNLITENEGYDKKIVEDDDAPTVEIIADTTDVTNANHIVYTIIFNEPIVQFSINGINVTNSVNGNIIDANDTKGIFTKIDDKTYSIAVTNDIEGVQTVTVPAGVTEDLSGNKNNAGTKEITISKTAPIVLISPNGCTSAKFKDIVISASAINGLKSNNQYQYCLTTNKNLVGNETWNNYVSDQAIRIGDSLNGTYYVHIKQISDNIGNITQPVTSNAFVFDNAGPNVKVIINSPTYNMIGVKIQASDVGNNMPSTPNYTYYVKKVGEASYSLAECYSEYDILNTVGNYNTIIYVEDAAHYVVKAVLNDTLGNQGYGESSSTSVAKQQYVSTSSCFVGNTPVLTTNGWVNIEDVIDGTKVITVNKNDNSSREVKEITKLMVSSTMDTYKIKLGDVFVESTPRHQFVLDNGEIVKAYDLKEGDLLKTGFGNSVKIESIEHITYQKEIPMYNLVFDATDDYNYYLCSDAQIYSLIFDKAEYSSIIRNRI